MKQTVGAIIFVILALGFVILIVRGPAWIRSNKQKIEDTGEKQYACTNEWQEDKLIQNCKWYPIYKNIK